MSGGSVHAEALGVTYDAPEYALRDVTLTWEANRIHGLLGRNGAGKSTLLSVLAALRRPSDGAITVDGDTPWERASVTERVCLIRESGDVLVDESVEDNLGLAESLRPTFDRAYADDLAQAFGLDPGKSVSALSRGQKSALGVVLGLASRAPVTVFDEVHLGMDAPARQRFYDELLADFIENPRTFIVSSHLISEIESLLETVTVLSRGRLLLHEEAEDIRTQGLTLTGPSAAVGHLVDGHRVIGSRDLGPTRQVTLFGGLDEATLGRARAAGVDVGAVPLQDLFIHLTEEDAR